MLNATRDTIWVDGCSLDLQHETDGMWQHVLGRDCPAIHDKVRKLVPGGISTDSIFTATDFARGRYQAVYMLRQSPDTSVIRLRASETFTLQ